MAFPQRPRRGDKNRKQVEGGAAIPRRYTQPAVDPLDAVQYTKRSCVIANPDGSVVFQMDDVQIPEGWSQLASDIVISSVSAMVFPL